MIKPYNYQDGCQTTLRGMTECMCEICITNRSLILGIATAEYCKKDYQTDSQGRRICPFCIEHNHIPGEPMDVCDCKNLILDDNDHRVIGQCQCYSKSHGFRTRR
jgi:hypothetical protein